MCNGWELQAADGAWRPAHAVAVDGSTVVVEGGEGLGGAAPARFLPKPARSPAPAPHTCDVIIGQTKLTIPAASLSGISQVAIRLGWGNWPLIDVFTSEGLPAFPFLEKLGPPSAGGGGDGGGGGSLRAAAARRRGLRGGGLLGRAGDEGADDAAQSEGGRLMGGGGQQSAVGDGEGGDGALQQNQEEKEHRRRRFLSAAAAQQAAGG